MSEWAREYFEHGYGQRWGLNAPSDQVRREAAGLWALMGSSPDDLLVDIGCGHGKFALALAERGARVVGLDVATSLLDRARHLAGDVQSHVSWTRGDMRRLPFRSGCADAAVIIDAFDFFDTDTENDKVLGEAARVLRAGGRLGLKVVNGGLVLDDFRQTEREERDGVVVVVANTLALDPPRLTQRLHVSGSRGSGDYERRQRLYRIDDLRAALGRAGFAGVTVFGSPEGGPFDAFKSSAIWAVGHRG